MTIRRQPSDFVVEERVAAAFESGLRTDPGREAPHAVYSLTKTSLTTPEAVQRLSRALRARPGALSYAGLKDKHAQTTQLVSVRATRHDAFPDAIEGPGWSASRRGWAAEQVTARAIDGNRFTIVVRDLSPEACDEMGARARTLLDPPEARPAEGPVSLLMVNYFGDQRFGSARHGEGFVARRLIEGDFEGALRLSIATPARKDSGVRREFTRLCASLWGQWQELLPQLPRCTDREAVERLAEGADFRAAFDALPEFFKLMCVEAFQSHLWNATARRLSEQIAAALAETPAVRTDDPFGAMVFPRPAAVGAGWRSLTLPLLAPKSKLVEPWGPAARAVLEAEGIDTAKLRIPGLRRPFFGEAPRPLFVTVARFVMDAPDRDELIERGRRLKRVLSFDLPRGSYATVVLRALGQ